VDVVGNGFHFIVVHSGMVVLNPSYINVVFFYPKFLKGFGFGLSLCLVVVDVCVCLAMV
jgi:hypothetical protein